MDCGKRIEIAQVIIMINDIYFIELIACMAKDIVTILNQVQIYVDKVDNS